MIAVSNFSRGGKVSHVYSEHSSFAKFVERNWMLNTTVGDRSRDISGTGFSLCFRRNLSRRGSEL
jgi:hypothetical protein